MVISSQSMNSGPAIHPSERNFEDMIETLSSTESTRPACRLGARFFHTIRNAEVYEGGPGEIPQRSPKEHV